MTTEANADDRFAGLKGKRFDFNAVEKRCLDLELAPVERLRREAARIELRALVAARAFLVERLGLPEDCQVKIVREGGTAVGVEVVEPHAPRDARQGDGAEAAPDGVERRSSG